MSDYKPTDEQIEALENEVVFARDAYPRLPDDISSIELVETLVISPAFQSILRAVAAEAWDEGAKWGALEVAGLPGSDPEYVQIKPGRNPYREEQDDEH